MTQRKKFCLQTQMMIRNRIKVRIKRMKAIKLKIRRIKRQDQLSQRMLFIS